MAMSVEHCVIWHVAQAQHLSLHPVLHTHEQRCSALFCTAILTAHMPFGIAVTLNEQASSTACRSRTILIIHRMCTTDKKPSQRRNGADNHYKAAHSIWLLPLAST